MNKNKLLYLYFIPPVLVCLMLLIIHFTKPTEATKKFAHDQHIKHWQKYAWGRHSGHSYYAYERYRGIPLPVPIVTKKDEYDLSDLHEVMRTFIEIYNSNIYGSSSYMTSFDNPYLFENWTLYENDQISFKYPAKYMILDNAQETNMRKAGSGIVILSPEYLLLRDYIFMWGTDGYANYIIYEF